MMSETAPQQNTPNDETISAENLEPQATPVGTVGAAEVAPEELPIATPAAAQPIDVAADEPIATPESELQSLATKEIGRAHV